jgi:hypothetical protein
MCGQILSGIEVVPEHLRDEVWNPSEDDEIDDEVEVADAEITLEQSEDGQLRITD